MHGNAALIRWLSLALALAVLLAAGPALTRAQDGGGCTGDCTTLQIDGDVPYEVWVSWSPLLIATPTGGWAFFSAQATEGPLVNQRRLYAARYDRAADSWQPASPLPGGEVQFGPSAVVDAQGTVHLVYSDRQADIPEAPSTLVYTVHDGQSDWTAPIPVAPSEAAGHQVTPSLTMDQNGSLHVVWQDQRNVTLEARAASAANADVLHSGLPVGGTWTAPIQVNVRPDPDTNASRPKIIADGERLIAVWSIYEVATGLDTAARVEWSSRPLADPLGWAPPRILFERNAHEIGGRLLDLAADPNGGAMIVYGRRSGGTALFFQRLAANSALWDQDVLITAGLGGSFPSLTIDENGTAYVVYNVGEGIVVEVGAVAIARDSNLPGPEQLLTTDEDGTQGRPRVTLDTNGNPWLIYMHEPPSGLPANEVRTRQNLSLSPA